MRLASSWKALAALSLPLATTAAASEPTTVTIWTWPLSAPSPVPLAQVSYSNNDNDDVPPTVANYKPPEIPYAPEDLVRVGLYDPKTADWRGSLTSAASFDPKNQHRLSVHVDESGLPYHVDFASFYQHLDPREERRRIRKAEREAAKPKRQKPTKGKKKANDGQGEDLSQPVLEIIKQQAGPSPYLNTPVALSPDGKAPEAEPEKSFLQKYWYIIAIFLVVQLVAAGSGGAEKK